MPRHRSGACGLALFVGGLLAIGACSGGRDDRVASDPFAPSVGFPSGAPARALAVLDEEAREIALAFQLDGEVGLLDAEHGTLTRRAADVGVSPIAMVALDTDGDGGGELATANAGDATLSLLHRADAGLEVWATTRLTLRPKHLSGADLDGDGNDELIATVGLQGEAGAGIEVWRARGARVEPVGQRWPIDGAFMTTTGDLDGDGDLDVIAVLPSDGMLAWASNDGAGRLTEAARGPVCSGPRAAAMAGGAIAVACRDGLALLDVSDASDLGRWDIDLVPIEGNLYDLAAGDFDGDGRADLATVDLTRDAVLVLISLPDGGWSAPLEHPVGADPVALSTADLGRDHDLDLIVSAFGTRTIDVLENTLSQPERYTP